METSHFFQDLWLYFKHCPDCWVITGIIIILLFVWIAYRRSQRTFSVYDGKTGKVRVSQSALFHLVKGVCDKVGSLQCQGIDFKKSGSKFDLTIRLRANVSYNMADLSNKLHQLLSQNLGRILGPERIGKLNLVITGFKGNVGDLPSATEGINPDQEPEEDFTLLGKK